MKGERKGGRREGEEPAEASEIKESSPASAANEARHIGPWPIACEHQSTTQNSGEVKKDEVRQVVKKKGGRRPDAEPAEAKRFKWNAEAAEFVTAGMILEDSSGREEQETLGKKKRAEPLR